jgi:hypothetical protein
MHARPHVVAEIITNTVQNVAFEVLALVNVKITAKQNIIDL